MGNMQCSMSRPFRVSINFLHHLRTQWISSEEWRRPFQTKRLETQRISCFHGVSFHSVFSVAFGTNKKRHLKESYTVFVWERGHRSFSQARNVCHVFSDGERRWRFALASRGSVRPENVRSSGTFIVSRALWLWGPLTFTVQHSFLCSLLCALKIGL